MSEIFILMLMVFCHITDDYYLQGKLASLKQREWWAQNAPEKLYQHDYIVALIVHAFSWAFMVMLPVAIAYQLNPSRLFFICFALNLAIHAFVDHLKANLRKINLITDQTLHIVQIIVTFFILM